MPLTILLEKIIAAHDISEFAVCMLIDFRKYSTPLNTTLYQISYMITELWEIISDGLIDT